MADEIENNNSLGTATILRGGLVSGSLANSSDIDYYREVGRYLDSEMTYEAIKINRQQNATISGDPERVVSKYNR